MNNKRSEAAKKVAAGRLRIGGRFISAKAEKVVKEAAQSTGVNPANIQRFLEQERQLFEQLIFSRTKTSPLTASAIERAIIDASSVYTSDGQRIDARQALHDVAAFKQYIIGYSQSKSFEFQQPIEIDASGRVFLPDYAKAKANLQKAYQQRENREQGKDFETLEELIEVLQQNEVEGFKEITVYGS